LAEVADELVPDDLLLTHQRHVEALQKARLSLQDLLAGIQSGISGELLAIDLRVVLDALAEITGEITNESILDSIFSRFCIGK
jgi:tRNA modification GTPase